MQNILLVSALHTLILKSQKVERNRERKGGSEGERERMRKREKIKLSTTDADWAVDKMETENIDGRK